ncbi:MAG: chitinase [Glaciecola sp.]|jgi:chitinase
MNQLSKYLFLSIAICAFAGCGSDAEQPQTPKVLVNAGQNIEVNEQVTVSVDGIATSAAGGITYAWSSVPTLVFEQADASAQAATSTVTAPSVTQITDYVLTLTAIDSNGTTGVDNITMSVNPVNALPTAVILAPSIDLYEIDSYPIATTVTLDASLSSDSDPQTSNTPISAYLWQQIAGPDVLAESILTSANLIFQTPILAQPIDITIRLQVTDQEGAISSVDKTLRLLSESETIPELSIGPVQTVFSGELLSLSGQASSTASGAEPFSALWSSDSLLAPIIGDANSMKTFSIAPLVYQQTEIVYQLSITDRYGNQRSKMQTLLVEPQTQTTLNDTGVSLNASNNDNLVAYQGEFAGQDAHNGYDRMASSGFSDKAGRGELGFDFTRLNQNGDEVDQNTIDWSCVRDNITGLIWENKTDVTDDLHAVEQIFTWYSLAENGGFAGDVNMGSSACNLSSGNCNTQAFVDAVNAQGLCGFFDWRLPSHSELLSLVHFGKLQPPLIENEYFPDMGTTSLDSPLWYWTFMPNVDGVNESGSQSAWAIDFESGVDNFINKSTQARIKLVRAGR